MALIGLHSRLVRQRGPGGCNVVRWWMRAVIRIEVVVVCCNGCDMTAWWVGEERGFSGYKMMGMKLWVAGKMDNLALVERSLG